MGYKKNKEPYTHELRERNLEIYRLVKSGQFDLWEVGELYPKPDGTPLSRQRIFCICKEVERLNEM